MTMEDEALEGYRALVTGGSRNLGAVIAHRLAVNGAQLAVTYHESKDEAHALVEQLHSETGKQHVAVCGDLLQAGDARNVVAEAHQRLGGGVDILVNNVGPWTGAPYAELGEAEWDVGIDGNLKSTYVVTQAAIPHMREQGWGRVVNVSAGSAFMLDHSVYALAKQSLLFLTQQLALELGPEITVNAVVPGQIAESVPEMEELEPGAASQLLSRTPGGRFVTRGEVADVIGLLCTPAFDMVTGTSIPMDGGWRLPRS